MFLREIKSAATNNLTERKDDGLFEKVSSFVRKA